MNKVNSNFLLYQDYVDHLVPVYQPIVKVDDGKVIGYEVLTRIINDDYGLNGSTIKNPSKCLVKPDIFWERVAQVGLQARAIAMFFERLMRDCARYPIQNTTLHINATLSSLSLPTTQSCLEDFKLRQPTNTLHVEINEQDSVNNSVIRSLIKLQEKGIKIGLDDWGHHNKSVNIDFRRLAFLDFVKFDKSLLTDEYSLVRFIGKFKKLGVDNIIIEGVETVDHLDLIKKHKCEYAQGYCYGKPSRTLASSGTKI